MLEKITLKFSAYIISYLSIAGYFLAYKYKEGYFNYFNIPSVYMNTVDFIDIIKMVSAIVAFLSFGVYILINPRRGKEGGNTWLDRIDRNGIPIVILIMIAGYFDNVVIRDASLIVILLILVYNLVLPLFFCRNVKGYNNKIDTFFKDRDQVDFMEVVKYSIKHRLISMILIIIILTHSFGIFVHLLGKQDAKKTTIYSVTEIEGVKHVVFNVSDEKVIATAITGNKISIDFSFHSKKDILIKKEKIKRLKTE